MADIRMCLKHDCPSREKCYRYKADPNPTRQTYVYFKIQDGKDRCEEFTPLSEERREA